MHRRQLLAALAALAPAGCLASSDDPRAATTTTRPTEPTVRSTTTTMLDASSQLDLGEWHTSETIAVAVDDYQLRTTIHDVDRDQQVAMPADQQLLLAEIRQKNIAQDTQRRHGFGFFGAVADGRVYEAVRDFDHPAYADPLNIRNFRVEVAGAPLDGFSDDTLDSGETIQRWFAVVVPRDLDAEQVHVAYDDPAIDGDYSVRWQTSSE
jgi:hypothetical protein